MGLFSKKECIYSKLKLLESLPIGSIIEIKDSNDKYMICDYKASKKIKRENKYIEFDYLCIKYPEGFMPDSDMIFVMHSDVKNVIFKGFDSSEREQFSIEVDQIREDLLS